MVNTHDADFLEYLSPFFHPVSHEPVYAFSLGRHIFEDADGMP